MVNIACQTDMSEVTVKKEYIFINLCNSDEETDVVPNSQSSNYKTSPDKDYINSGTNRNETKSKISMMFAREGSSKNLPIPSHNRGVAKTVSPNKTSCRTALINAVEYFNKLSPKKNLNPDSDITKKGDEAKEQVIPPHAAVADVMASKNVNPQTLDVNIKCQTVSTGVSVASSTVGSHPIDATTTEEIRVSMLVRSSSSMGDELVKRSETHNKQQQDQLSLQRIKSENKASGSSETYNKQAKDDALLKRRESQQTEILGESSKTHNKLTQNQVLLQRRKSPDTEQLKSCEAHNKQSIKDVRRKKPTETEIGESRETRHKQSMEEVGRKKPTETETGESRETHNKHTNDQAVLQRRKSSDTEQVKSSKAHNKQSIEEVRRKKSTETETGESSEIRNKQSMEEVRRKKPTETEIGESSETHNKHTNDQAVLQRRKSSDTEQVNSSEAHNKQSVEEVRKKKSTETETGESRETRNKCTKADALLQRRKPSHTVPINKPENQKIPYLVEEDCIEDNIVLGGKSGAAGEESRPSCSYVPNAKQVDLPATWASHKGRTDEKKIMKRKSAEMERHRPSSDHGEDVEPQRPVSTCTSPKKCTPKHQRVAETYPKALPTSPLRTLQPNDARTSGPKHDSSVASVKSNKAFRAKRKQLYTTAEKKAIISYIENEDMYEYVKGRLLWENMESESLCPGRSWQSMKEHFLKKVLPNITQYASEESAKRFRYCKRRSIRKEVGNKTRMKHPYSTREDITILKYVMQNKRYMQVKGNMIWQRMEDLNILQDRTWQSLKNRYCRYIIENIASYNIPTNIQKRLKEYGLSIV